MDLEYNVIEQCSKKDLKKEVEKSMKDGWKLQGGGFTSLHEKHNKSCRKIGSEVGYLQAMTREKKKDKGNV